MLMYLLLSAVLCVHSKELHEAFSWTRINYALPTNAPAAITAAAAPAQPIVFPGYTGRRRPTKPEGVTNLQANYQFENNVPMGANMWKDKLFVTVPRRRNGVPSTLNYIWLNTTEKQNVPLIPYPDLESNQIRSSGQDLSLVSVYRTAIDECDRIWMVDTGRIEIPGNSTQVHPPAIVIMDLLTNKLVRRYELRPEDIKPTTTLANLAVDVTKSNCGSAFAYIPDLSGYGLVVYSFEENNSWRVAHNYFYLEPLAGEFYIGGVNFQWNDGIFSIALSNIGADGFRKAYFHSMAGSHIYSVSTRILRDRQLATRSYHANDFQREIDRGLGSQTSASDLHKSSGVLFLALVNQNALGCWNTNKRPSLENFDVIYKNDQKFIYPSDVKIRDDYLIVLTNTMPVFLYRRLNYDEVNFRVWITNVNDAIKGTSCMAN